MPIRHGCDKNGSFVQWGTTGGKKYYYTPGNKRSEQAAMRKARKQESAIYASSYKGA